MSKNATTGKYRRLSPWLWRHPDFQRFTPSQKNICVYVLTGPQTNRLGLFHLSCATAAEDLMLGAATFRTGLLHVCRTFAWIYDAEARVMYIPTWWKWNHPDNPHVLVGNLRDLSEIPRCALAEVFAHNLRHLPPDLRATFTQTCQTRLPRRAGHQEQEQEQVQEQEQEPRSARETTIREAFDQFWDLYPRKEAEDGALRVWMRLKPDDATVTAMIAALRVQTRTWDNPKFIPHARTWLSEGRWKDEVDPPKEVPDFVNEEPWVCPHVIECSNTQICANATACNRPRKPNGLSPVGSEVLVEPATTRQ